MEEGISKKGNYGRLLHKVWPNRTRLLLTAFFSLLLLSPAIAGEQKSSLLDAQSIAQEIANQGKSHDVRRNAISPKGRGMIPLPDASLDPAKRADSGPSAAFRQGISIERLRGFLEKCPDRDSQAFLKNATHINGMWVGTAAAMTEGVRRCLGEEGAKRLAGLLKSRTFSDQACKMVSGSCVTFGNHYCNDADCQYYAEYPGSADSDKACYLSGYCHERPYFYCNKLNCRSYSP